ncbi:NUDIX domain-containing protein [Nocardia gipuzkoensis]
MSLLVRERMVLWPTEAERAEVIAGLPRKRMGAGALFVDELDRVLLVEPTYTNYWELPGGVVEADESPYAAVVREIGEELSLTAPQAINYAVRLKTMVAACESGGEFA